MHQLMACVWIDFFSDSTVEQSARRMQTVIRNFIKKETEGAVYPTSRGVWVFVNSAQQAVDIGLSVIENLNIGVEFRVLLTAGDVRKQSGTWSGWAIEQVESLTKQLEVGQIWFTEAFFHMMHMDALPWNEIGMVSTDKGSHRCFRLLASGECAVPSAFKRLIAEQKVLVCRKGEDVPPLRKGKHVAFVGYAYGEELHAVVAKANTVIPNDKLWLIMPALSGNDRAQWGNLGRHLIIGDSTKFLEDTVRSDLTLMGQDANSTMFLDPVSLASGELSLCGLALPKVPMARIIDGYSVDLLQSGEWGYGQADNADVLLRVVVNLSGETVVAMVPNCRMNSKEMEVGKAYPLGSGARLTVKRLTYRYIANVGKPYQGLFLGEPSRRIPLSVGEQLELGRQPAGGGFELPDRGGADRLDWAMTPQAQSAKQNKLTLDRALTGRHHVALSILSVGKFSIAPMHDKLPTFVLSQSSQHLSRVNGEQTIRNEGLIVVGTNVLKIAKTQ